MGKIEGRAYYLPITIEENHCTIIIIVVVVVVVIKISLITIFIIAMTIIIITMPIRNVITTVTTEKIRSSSTLSTLSS